ncbi:VOC family protein [Epibacterium ulvae]|uniref:VOC family protein n=1 Tax=Epibacterium ulvae TaxID=1156985 RepID=UPI001BFC504C|nr:VOC family protein [Epibacterium ulvae]MBT8154893.1 VOC family protein [Epibacterium ulvae]
MTAILEHANVTVTTPAATAAWMEKVFGWHIRWQGDSIDGGHSMHVGSDTSYVALYTPNSELNEAPSSYVTRGGLNHLAVIVEDYEATERAVVSAGFKPGEHYDYEPGRRFYFHDDNGIEFEVVTYD